MVCPHCGNGSNPADANFCEECGGALAEAPIAAEAEPVPVTAGVARAAGAGSPSAATSSVTAVVGDSQPVAPPLSRASAEGETQALDAWTCTCGRENPDVEAYCADCGEAKPVGGRPLVEGDAFAGFVIVARLDAQTCSVRRPEEAS